jgi:hypothetical protein
MSFRRRREVKQKCSMTGKPKRPWRTQWFCNAPNTELIEEPVSYNAAPGPKQRPKLKRHPVTPMMRDLLSALHAVRLGIPLSDRGRAILWAHLRSQQGTT